MTSAAASDDATGEGVSVAGSAGRGGGIASVVAERSSGVAWMDGTTVSGDTGAGAAKTATGIGPATVGVVRGTEANGDPTGVGVAMFGSADG